MPAGKLVRIYRKPKPALSLREKKAVRKIARSEAKKARAKNYKDFYIGTYTNDGRVNSTVSLDHTLVTVRSTLHAVPLYDEDTQGGDSLATRANETIYIRGFAVSGQILYDSSSDMRDTVVQLVLWRQKRGATPTEAKVLSNIPTTVYYNKLNGSLPDEDEVELMSKVQILAVKTIPFRLRLKADGRHTFRFSKFWKRPQRQNFAPSDLTGVNPFDYAYFISARTDHDNSTLDINYRIAATIRCSYFTE